MKQSAHWKVVAKCHRSCLLCVVLVFGAVGNVTFNDFLPRLSFLGFVFRRMFKLFISAPLFLGRHHSSSPCLLLILSWKQFENEKKNEENPSWNLKKVSRELNIPLSVQMAATTTKRWGRHSNFFRSLSWVICFSSEMWLNVMGRALKTNILKPSLRVWRTDMKHKRQIAHQSRYT